MSVKWSLSVKEVLGVNLLKKHTIPSNKVSELCFPMKTKLYKAYFIKYLTEGCIEPIYKNKCIYLIINTFILTT